MNRPIHGGNLAWAAALADCSPDSILDFSASINPFGPPASAIAAIEDNLSSIHAYPDPEYQQLRHAISEVYHIPPEFILPGNGVAELLTWAGWELAKQEFTSVITPAFNDYWRTLRAFGGKIIRSQLHIGGTTGELPFAPSAVPVSYIQPGLLLSNPHNPTGLLFKREALIPYLSEFGLVVVDEAFMDFLPPQEQQSLIPLIKDYPNLVVLRSLTKFYSIPGLRLGFAVAHPDRIQRWQKRRDPWSVNTLAAAVGVAVLADSDFQQKTWDWLPKTRKKLYQDISKLSGFKPYPSSANFILVECKKSSTEIQEQLLKQHRIFIRDCVSFPELGDRFLRVAVRTPEDNKLLVSALATIV